MAQLAKDISKTISSAFLTGNQGLVRQLGLSVGSMVAKWGEKPSHGLLGKVDILVEETPSTNGH
jgi:hypothetical protein